MFSPQTLNSRIGDVHDLLSDDLDLANVNYLLEALSQKKQRLEAVWVSFRESERERESY